MSRLIFIVLKELRLWSFVLKPILECLLLGRRRMHLVLHLMMRGHCSLIKVETLDRQMGRTSSLGCNVICIYRNLGWL